MLAQRMTYGLLAMILFVYALIAVKSFLVPIAFGFLLAYLLFPVADWLERKKIPRILANLITILAGTIVLVGISLIIYQRISIIANDFPDIAREGAVNLSEMVSNIGQYLGFDKDETRTFIQKETAIILESGSRYFSTIFSATTSTAVALGLLPVYVFMFLYYRTKFMYFILKTVNRKARPKVIHILRQISTVMVRYMAGVLMVVFILTIINSFGLHLIGMRYAIALGVISALFNLIPYFGTLLGGLVPFLFALLVQGDMLMAFRVVLLFIVIQFIENNILTPNIVGGNVRISPFFIITGLFGASMVWGIPGMLLIVPFLAVLRIVFSHLDSMRPYAYLIGDEGTRKHAISKENFMIKWNRIFKKKNP
ncbi:MAG: AI-2E family transporter [Bacteroidota bacterium]